MFHMDLGLGRVGSSLARLGLDHPPYLSAQVLGTNGKGSTSTFLATALSCSGVRTGLYTSPHFVSPRERVLVDARPVPDAMWLDAAEAVLSMSQDLGEKQRLTYFELLTVMAAWIFREAGCGACVFEAGLGGEHDATTALPRHLTVYTPIGLDHVSILGPELTDIAQDKAGAMRPGVPALTARQDPAVEAVLLEAASRAGAPMYHVSGHPERLGLTRPGTPGRLPRGNDDSRAGGRSHLFGEAERQDEILLPGDVLPDAPSFWTGNDIPLPAPAMPGPHQRSNFQLAACALALLSLTRGTPFSAAALDRAAREAFIPGRFQVIPASGGEPAFILDGAHNEPGLRCLREALDGEGATPAGVVFSCMADKDLEAMLPLVRTLTSGPLIVPPVDAPGRAMDPAELARMLGGNARPAGGVREALAEAGKAGGTVLVCGSLYLLGEVYALRPEWLAKR